MKRVTDSKINPYIATTDVMVSVIVVFVLMLAVVSAASGTGTSRQRDLLAARIQMLNRAVEELPEVLRPVPDVTRNDPEGTQRWRFSMGSSSLTSAPCSYHLRAGMPCGHSTGTGRHSCVA